MRKTFLQLNNAKKLNRESQKSILGGSTDCPPKHYAVQHNGYTACCRKTVSNPCELVVNFCLMPMGMCGDER